MEINDRILSAGPWHNSLVGATVTDIRGSLARLRKLDGDYSALPIQAVESYTDPTNWVRRVAEAGSPEAACWVAQGYSPEVARERVANGYLLAERA